MITVLLRLRNTTGLPVLRLKARDYKQATQWAQDNGFEYVPRGAKTVFEWVWEGGLRVQRPVFQDKDITFEESSGFPDTHWIPHE